jgi:hypothetical protein
LILFLFYAVFVWYLCFRYRRNWRGLLIFVASMATLWLLADLYRVAIRWAKVNRHAFLDTRNDGQLFLMLLAVEAVIVAGVGLFFWCLPRAGALKPCRRCGYELAGLDDDNPTCPECGTTSAAARLRTRECPSCQQSSTWRYDRDACDQCHTPPRASMELAISPARAEGPPLPATPAPAGPE